MELDVHLSRAGDEAWGFRLIGGSDFNMPLTVVKILPDSPAEQAGLQNGDTVARIGDKVADDLSHDAARLIVDAAGITLTLGVKRGLYDPVLDNYDPIYEDIDIDQIDRADIDQPSSQPTEVLDTFQIQQFLDPNQDIFPPIAETPKLESRSLTASPFVLNTKPYRPFSTEPSEVPPLEDPIILNPNYKDEFGKILDLDDLIGDYESKFKLPISEQYDPDWEKKEKGLDGEKKGLGVSVTVKSQDLRKATEKVEVKEVCVKKVTLNEDVAFMTKMKQDIDLNKIEMTATSIVDESIERAKSVAEEIKKEIDVELSDLTSLAIVDTKSVIDSKFSSETKSESRIEKSEARYESKQSNISEHEDLGIVKREMIVKESKEIKELEDASEVKVAKKVEIFETIDVNQVSDERKKCVQNEVQEVIEAGSVRRKSMMFDKEETNVDDQVKVDVKAKVKTDFRDENIQKVSKSIKNISDVKVSDTKIVNTDVKHENIKRVSKTNEDISETKVSGTKTSTQAENRAYTIGLKTIPNIRGTVHSSYHYNLLLQTFFLHLTDVMVALSRFILTEPVFNKVEEKTNVTTTQQMTSSSLETRSEMATNKHEDLAKSQIKKTAVQEKTELNDAAEIKKEAKTREVIEKTDEVKHAVKVELKDQAVDIKTHKKAITGSEMAQLTEKKSEGLTVKMDAVISEFETKSGIEEVSERRRSRSRSQVVEEVMKESDPLEWLSKNDSQKTEITDFSTESLATKREISTVVKSAAEKKIESRHGSRPRSTTPNEGKQMYVAIVESHVYTNKDAVLVDQSEEFETESLESIEDTKTVESIAAVVTVDNVRMEKSKIKEQKASIIENKREEVAIAKKEVTTESVVKEARVESTKTEQKVQEVIQQVIEPKVEIYESKQLDVKEEIQQLSFKEEVLQETKESVAEQTAVQHIQNDIKIQETVIVEEPKVEIFESKIDIKEETQKVSINEEIIQVARNETVEIQEIVNESLAIEEEHENLGYVELAKEELSIIKEEQTVNLDTSANIKIDRVEIKEIEPQTETAALKIVKEEIVEVQPSPEIVESQVTKILKIENSVDMSKGIIVESDSQFVDISESSSLDSFDVKSRTQESSFTAKSSNEASVASIQESSFIATASLEATSIQESSFAAKSISEATSMLESSFTAKSCEAISMQESSFTAKSINEATSIQESSFTAKSTASTKNLSLKTDIVPQLDQQSVPSDENNNIDTPTPSTVPPTPLTDEYVFKLQIPLPKTSGVIIPMDLTPEEEDPLIVKKKLVPHIETTLESPIIYDPPLPSPPANKVGSPVYTKPGLRGGNIYSVKKEEILEIERKSTLLASAIDETIKSIEEYKEQVGMETKKEIDESTDSYCKIENYSKQESSVTTVSKTEVKRIEDEWTNVDKQVKESSKTLTELSKTAMEDSKIVSKLTDLVNGNISLANGFDALDKKSSTEMADEITEKTIENIIDNAEKIFEQDTIESNGLRICDEVATENISVDVVNSTEEVISNNNAELVTNGGIPMRNSIIDVGFAKDEEVEVIEEKEDPMKGYRSVVFNPEPMNPRATGVYIVLPTQETGRPYTTPTGELLGTHQGIVDGLEEATVDEEIAKQLGKPGMTEEKIAELISGESEMLREAHVMGLSRVLTSHMSRADDGSSVDFKKIKPIVESLKDSEVLKALNDELVKTQEERKKEERNWTTFLQKPTRAVPRVKFGYHAYVDQEELVIETPYKVKIVKQPKPKVAPDYKQKDFETGPLPWEERALNEPPPPPVEAEDPILVPEEEAEFLEAVDPLPESEVPDLEDTGIQLPPPKSEEEQPIEPPETIEEVLPEEEEVEPEVEPAEETTEDMDNTLADQLMSSVQNMVDPNASLEQQLSQMRAQLAALAQLPGVITQTLQLVSQQLNHLTQQESVSVQMGQQTQQSITMETQQCLALTEVNETHEPTISEETAEDVENEEQTVQIEELNNEQEREEAQPSLTQEEMEKLRKEEEEMLEEQRRIEKQKKEMMEQMRQDQESRQLKQRPTPRVGKPKPVFGNGDQERPMVLPGGRRWKGPKDAYNDQFIAETLSAQAEMIQGKTKGMSYESDILPYDERINFLKYEKPPVSLDHLQHSDVYKMVHNMDLTPGRRVDLLTPVVAEADYREKCRSISPCVGRMAQEQHQEYPQQVQP